LTRIIVVEEILNRPYKTKINKKYNILYVDDEEVNLRIFQRAFKRNYEVFTANSGHEAMNVLENNPVDLIMTDQRMPKMSGVELLIKIVPQYPNIVRMIMTGFSDEQEIMRVDDEVGLDRYMVKPWNKDDLLDEFERALKLRNAGNKSDQKASEETEEPLENAGIDFVESTLSMVEESHENAPGAVAPGAVAPGAAAPEAHDIKDESTHNLADQSNESVYEENHSHSVNLLEALLPNQQELKLYIEDGFINFEHYVPAKYGYWFGENDQKLIIASFNAVAPIKQALALNIFLCACLTELIYKDGLASPIEIISNMAMRINHRFFNTKSFNKDCAIDIAIMAYDDQAEQISFCGANHDLYYFDTDGVFNSLKSADSSISPGVGVEYNAQELNAAEVSEIYFIPNNPINDNPSKRGGASGALTARRLLEEIHKYPMSMQAKLLKDYKYGSLIGIRF